MEAKARLLDLLVERAVAGLTPPALLELEGLLDAHPEWANDSFDMAAAAVDLALLDAPAPLPRGLRGHLSSLALYCSLPHLETETPSPADPILSGHRASFMTEAPDLLHLPWSPADDPAMAEVEGDVVWSDRLQTGYALLRGLEPNDADTTQYQLWILDADREAHYPVDAGVFDAVATEIIVVVQPKLPIGRAGAFLVTRERPGGVVVSDQAGLVARAVPEQD